MFAGAQAAAAMGGQQQHRRQEQQQEDEDLQRLHDLPSENLPLLAAAALVAEEIERTENAVAAAFSAPAQLQLPVPTQLPHPQQQHHQQMQPPPQQYPAAAPSLLSPRHARRILSLQPAAAPV
jgi:hypothetical protein